MASPWPNLCADPMELDHRSPFLGSPRWLRSRVITTGKRADQNYTPQPDTPHPKKGPTTPGGLGLNPTPNAHDRMCVRP